MMDLNVLPPEEEEEDKTSQKSSHVKHKETAVEIARREREERKQKLKRQRINDLHDRQIHAPKQAIRMNYDNDYNHKPFRSCDKNKLPFGWLECPSMGRYICGIIPSKVPLGEIFNDCVPDPGKRYSFKQVFAIAKHIGMVIDLTNTSIYYQVSDLKKNGIKHMKIPCKGRDSVPDNESVNRFVYEVSQFFSRQSKGQEKHVLVHCTHGHNRTGFMIVHYLVRMFSFSVREALEIFADARPPGIYKPDYINALYMFYHENRPEAFIFPQTPEWKRSYDLDLNGDAVRDDGDDDGDGTDPVQENHEISKVMSNDDILGDNIPYDQQDDMRHICYKLLKLEVGRKGVSQFPGSHPVSLDNDNLISLRQRYYHATWKADGTRYMMLITLDGCYLIDRNFNFQRVQMRFPCRSPSKDVPDKTHHYTLLDGEMIIDTRKQERRYLVYDMMAFNQESTKEYLFFQRWELLEKEVIKPRDDERELICSTSKDCFYKYDMEPFGVERKDFWPLSKVNKLLTEIIPTLSYEADGLIFQPWDDPYVPLADEKLLKWKYAHMNSVDFLFEIVDEQWLIYCFERGKKKLIEEKVQFSNGIDPVSCVGKIIECSCSWESDEKVWVYMRLRPDKSTPNHINTYRKVLRSIEDNITQDVLMIEINDAIGLPMYVYNFKKWTNEARDMGEGRS